MRHLSFTIDLPIEMTALAGLALSALCGHAQSAAIPHRQVIVAENSTISQNLANDAATAGSTIVTLGSRRSSNAVDASSLVPLRSVDVESLSYSGPGPARRYFITELGTLGGTQSFAYALNDNGQVVGESWTVGDSSSHAFLFTNGKMTDLYPLNSQDIQTVGPTAINNAGQIASGVVVDGVYVPAILDSVTGNLILIGSLGGVSSLGFKGVATSVNNEGNATGYSYLDNLNRHGFFYRNGVMTDIGSFGGFSVGLAINDENDIAGFASDTYNGVAHAFVDTDGVMTDLDPATESYGNDINNQSQIVGQFLTADQTAFHAFLYSQGNFADPTPSGGQSAIANGINNEGQIVGSQSFADKLHAFLYYNGRIVDLNTLIPRDFGWELIRACDVNNRGQIVGYGLVHNRFRAYLLTPAISPDQCNYDAWKSFGFRNQGQCIGYVNTGK